MPQLHVLLWFYLPLVPYYSLKGELSFTFSLWSMTVELLCLRHDIRKTTKKSHTKYKAFVWLAFWFTPSFKILHPEYESIRPMIRTGGLSLSLSLLSLPPSTHTLIPISHNAKCALGPALYPLNQSIVMDSLYDCNAMHTNDQDRATLAESSQNNRGRV